LAPFFNMYAPTNSQEFLGQPQFRVCWSKLELLRKPSQRAPKCKLLTIPEESFEIWDLPSVQSSQPLQQPGQEALGFDQASLLTHNAILQ